MSNTFLSAKTIARESLPILKNNLVMANLVHTDYSSVFANQGAIIQARKPAKFSAVGFDGDLSGEYQDITQTSVEVEMDTIASVDFKITSKELTLSIEDFRNQVLEPAMVAIAEKVDSDIMTLYKDIPYYYGTSGATPDALSDIAGVRKILNNNKVPMRQRRLVIDTEAEAKLIALDSLVEVDKAGTAMALREAILGKVHGLEIYMDQNVPEHTAGSFVEVAAPKTDGVTAAGATTITMDGGSGAETIKEGDIFTIDTVQFTATADATASSGEIDVPVYPAVPGEIANDTDVEFADASSTSHTANLAFHRNAFALVSRALQPPMGGADAATMNFDGLSLRVTMDYNMDTKTNIVSVDILYGIKTLYPELAARLLG